MEIEGYLVCQPYIMKVKVVRQDLNAYLYYKGIIRFTWFACFMEANSLGIVWLIYCNI